MATLTAAISSSVTEFSVSGDVSAAKTGQEYRIDDEVIVLREFVRTKAERRGPRNRGRWSVSRGQAGTVAASHLIGAEIFALNGAVATATESDLVEPAPFAGTGDGGAGVLVDPGNVWEASSAVAVGHRFAETVDGALRVFEVSVAGTTGAGVFSDYGPFDLTPNGEWGTNSETFLYRGIVGYLPWTVLPAFGGGLELGPMQDNGHALLYTSAGAPEDSESLFVFRATVDGVPVSVFEVKTDGDADWYLDDDVGGGVRFQRRDAEGQGVPGITEMTTSGFSVSVTGAGAGGFHVLYDPFSISVSGLPTADPASAGKLWVDVAAGRVLKVSAG